MNSGKQVVLGVDFGSTKIQVGAVLANGQVEMARKYPVCRHSQEDSISSLQNAISAFLQEWDGPFPVAIGVGLVGHIDREKGIWVHSMNARISEPVPIADMLREQFQVPVFIDNDVHCATLAECYFGIGRISKYFLMINVGTGIGFNAVDNGRIIRGVANGAGEFGHMSVESDGLLCQCGFFGCLENIAGGAALIQQAEQLLPLYPDSSLRPLAGTDALHSESIFQAASQGDPMAMRIARRAVKALGIGIVNLTNLFNPEYIVLAGSVMRNEWYVGHVKKFVYDNTLLATMNCLRGMGPSQLNVSAVGMYGAAALCFEPQDIENVNAIVEAPEV